VVSLGLLLSLLWLPGSSGNAGAAAAIGSVERNNLPRPSSLGRTNLSEMGMRYLHGQIRCRANADPWESTSHGGGSSGGDRFCGRPLGSARSVLVATWAVPYVFLRIAAGCSFEP